MYGTTEVGTVLVNYPGAEDFDVRRGSLGKPIPGTEVDVHNSDGQPCHPGESGELVVRRKDKWISTKDHGRKDADGYFYYGGRSDDIIISAGWTMSAIEIEDVLLKHEKVEEAAVIGVPDALYEDLFQSVSGARQMSTRGLLKSCRNLLKSFKPSRVPRDIEFVDAIPKTPAGKVNRKVLRDQFAT